MTEDKRQVLCEIKDLKLQIGGRYINYNNLDIKEDDYILIVGENGCGKSTLFRAMRLFTEENGVRYYKSEEGSSIKYSGIYSENIEECKNILDFERYVDNRQVIENVVLISQEDESLDGISVWGALNLEYTNAVKNKYKDKEKRQRLIQKGDAILQRYVTEYLTRVFKDDIASDNKNRYEALKKIFKRKRFSRCSGGQKKIICIMAKLLKMQCLNSRILLMDEPLNNLDREMKITVSNLISELREQKIVQNDGTTIAPAVIIISHCNIFLGINKIVEIKRDCGFIECEVSSPQKCLCGEDVVCSEKLNFYTFKRERE